MSIENKKIKGGKLLLNITLKDENTFTPFLWDVTEENSLVNVKELYYSNFSKIPFQTRENPSFKIISRNGKIIIFDSRIVFNHHQNLYDIYPMAKNLSGSVGINSCSSTLGKYGYSVNGFGIIDENSGLLLAQPFYQKLKIQMRYQDLPMRRFIIKEISMKVL
ncbi:hypothetical protein [Chryseobacterium sp. CCH4-E10]|uniref:hypothetical protein n=1 Tax=Chryseobacterium sp. CCH4-E10 TaxID=1768758 RepID=UPI000833A57D|nr:hypothetical protein [Chryseobacterium sp. CCH4-E10]